MRVHAVALTPDTLRTVLPGGEKGCAQLVELPEGLRMLAGELRELNVKSSRLVEVPAWVGELTRLQVLELGGDFCLTTGDFGNNCLTALPAGLFQLGALKQLTLRSLFKLQELPETFGRITALERLTLSH